MLKLRKYLALEHDIVVVSAAMLLVGFGEQLWKKFAPKFLVVLGAPIVAVGLYGTIQDTLDGLYQYPGGWLSDHLGRRRALFILVALATAGYAIYAGAGWWPVTFIGLAFVMAWQSMASPTLFAIVGDSLPREQRAMGFTVQAILRRVPMALGPMAGGLLIARFGFATGFRTACLISIATGIITLVLLRNLTLGSVKREALSVRGVWTRMPVDLRRLLVADIFARTCEGLVDVLVVLYVLDVLGIAPTRFGMLVAIQMVTSILSYIPAAHISDRGERTPLVAITFLAFAFFPLSVALSDSFGMLVVAYIIAGLRELGEPSRKALIVDLVDPDLRGRSVGLYYLIRSLTIAPAAVIGSLLWKISPVTPFYAAFAVGLLGCAAFGLMARKRA
jgi:MFS family permease